MTEPYLGLLKLLRTKDQEVVRIRASSLSSYYWCAVQARLRIEGVEAPKKEVMTIGTKIHKMIDVARKPSTWEHKLNTELAKLGIKETETGYEFSRRFKSSPIEILGDTIVLDGQVSGHPDELKVNADHTIHMIEYKTTRSSYITWIGLGPASFQLKLYIWITQPVFEMLGYKVNEASIVFITQKRCKVIGEHYIHIDNETTEAEITQILTYLNGPIDKLIPPRRWKCLHCPQVYKKRCPYH